MKIAKACVLVATLAGLAGCGVGDLVGRASEGGSTLTGIVSGRLGTSGEMVAAHYAVDRFEISVPRGLTVSEANVFVPRSDIVWHGDPLGDRREQVRDILTDAAGVAGQSLGAGQHVVVQVELVRFHALTPKARYTVGGNYATRFVLTVRDSASGEIVDGPRLVVADLKASGGQRALEEEAQGLTQRVVITAHLADVLRQELSQRLVTAEPGVARARFEPAALDGFR